MAVSDCIGFSVCSDVTLDTTVAKLNGWVLVKKPDGTRAWEEGGPMKPFTTQ